jgi:hypothetical protein
VWTPPRTSSRVIDVNLMSRWHQYPGMGTDDLKHVPPVVLERNNSILQVDFIGSSELDRPTRDSVSQI